MAAFKSTTKSGKWLLFLVAIFFIVILGATAGYWTWEKNYENRIYPGVKIGNIDLSGKTEAEAEQILKEKIAELNQEGIPFRYQDETITITPTVSSFSGGLAYNIMDFDPKQTVNNAYSIGREKGFWLSLGEKFQTWRHTRSVPFQFDIKQKEVKKTLKKNFQDRETSPSPTRLEVVNKTNHPLELQIKESRPGKVIDYSRGIKRLKEQLRNLNFSPIELSSQRSYPDIHKEDCQSLKPLAYQFLEKAPLTLLTPIKNNDNASKEWTINKNQLANWLKIKKNATTSEPELGLDQEKVTDFLRNTIAPEVDREPKQARFEIKNGRVVKFKASQDGIQLAQQTSAQKIEREFIQKENTEIKLITETVTSKVTADKANDLGIKEKIGTGHSNFAGSPPNRVHNINIGAQSLAGILIKPEEEFSLVEALRPINKEKGYKPELVIKGDETVPEYGGGLCQIATTMFRAALRSGLEVTARTSHSYQVSYYKPTGMDATVYIPRPDLKFKNDTDHHILIQYRIEGNDLYFDLWGTDDGREVKITDPTVYNIKNPGPTKIIKTDELEPGKKKCTESAHKGADAYFDYIVKYPERETKERRFHSHYVPWREVCLIGKKGDEDESEQDNESSSDHPNNTFDTSTSTDNS